MPFFTHGLYKTAQDAVAGSHHCDEPVGAAACSKTSKDAIAGGTQKIWLRIIQVYKDGARQYSKIVQVITED